MSSIVEEIKSRLNIVDVVGAYVKLERAGGSLKARCPFHSERSASFFVSPGRQTYHCFGCSRGGDMISFVEEMEGLDFSGALKVLALRAGVELKHQTMRGGDDAGQRELLYRALDLATQFYQAVLIKFPEALSYLHQRGLTDETIKNFRIGFAADAWSSLYDILIKKGITAETMERAGLIVRGNKGWYDRFRGRIMFPLTDMSGRVVAFSGRVLKDDHGKTLGASSQAKYVNSPETEVFQKSRILFGFHLAKQAMRQADQAVLVEGQMDLILSHQAGVMTTVASSGTALTALQLSLIKRFTQNIVIAFDADSAGLAAAHRAVGLALVQGMSVRMARLSRGEDPADIALRSPEEWRKVIETAKHVIDFYLEKFALECAHDSAMFRREVSRVVIPFIAELKSVIDQGHYVGQAAKLLHLKEEPVWEEVRKCGLRDEYKTTKDSLLHTPPVSRKLRIAQTIEGLLLWQEREKVSLVHDLRKLRSRFNGLLRSVPGSSEEFEQGIGKREKLVFEAEARFHGAVALDEEIEDLFRNLEGEIIRERLARKMDDLKTAEASGNAEEARNLLGECQELSKQLHAYSKE